MNHCQNMNELMQAQLDIIKRHIDRHKWFQHIDDRDKAIEDFIEKYAWLMREMFCLFTCPHSTNCFIREKLLGEERGPSTMQKVTSGGETSQ